MVNEGIYEVKTGYTFDELIEVTIQAGLTPAEARGGMLSTWKGHPRGWLLDIFEMDGQTNEHKTSTGINDCATTAIYCHTFDEVGSPVNSQLPGSSQCVTRTEPCVKPNPVRFEAFWNIVDLDGDGIWTRKELLELDDGSILKGVPFIDANPLGVNTMAIAFALLLDVFGLPPNRDRFDKATLWSVFIDRKFPHWYHYPNPHNVTEPHSLDCDSNGVCSYTAEALKDRPS